MKYKSIKGTRDILPGESRQWQMVEDSIRRTMHVYNFKEIRTPVFEETALFARGIGELTDIVGKEMYTFTDRGGTSITLKPEMTASVIRAYLQHNLGEQQSVVKTYYIAPMFRQERPQAGRLRQFHQFGAEVIGTQQPEADAEVISLAVQVYHSFGIENFSLRINSVGCEQCRPPYKDKLIRFLENVRLHLSGESQQRLTANPLRVLDSKHEADQSFTADAPLIKDYLCSGCGKHFEKLQETLTQMEVSYDVDGRIVRGLDYYTKTAFEIVSSDLGSQDALAGGGRYDLLAGALGGKPTPAVGFAAGVERLMLVLERQQRLAENNEHPLIYLAAADVEGRIWTLRQAAMLRKAGFSCDSDLLARSLKAQMREADRQQADYVLVAGQKEISENKAVIKHMKSGVVREILLSELSDSLRELRA